MLAAPAQAETWSCSAAVGSDPVTFKRNDGNLVIQSNSGSQFYEIIFENEASIQLLFNPQRRAAMGVLLFFKKSKRFKMFSLVGPDLEFPVPSRPAGYTKGSYITE